MNEGSYFFLYFMAVFLVGIAFFIVLRDKFGFRFGQAQGCAPDNALPANNEEQNIPNRQAMIAAVSAVVAEELGTSVSNIRIHSFKKR